MKCVFRFFIPLGLFAVAASAQAYCYEPDPPRSLPSQPYCMYNVCELYEAEGYRGEIQDYIQRLQSYAAEAAEYADCMAKQAVSEWNDFASVTAVRE